MGSSAAPNLDALGDPKTKVRKRAPIAFTALELQSMTFPPVNYVVPDIIPDGLTIFAGKPKIGKSWYSMDVAIAVARGGFTLGDRKCLEGDVLYAALEDNPRRLSSRMETLLGVGRSWPARLSFWTEMPRLDAGGLELIADWIAQAPKPRLVIIDTFVKVRSSKGKEESIYDADYRSVTPLKALSDQTGVAVVLVHHLRKMESDDPLDAVSGSTGLTGSADTILVLNRSSEGVTLCGRGRDIAEIELAVQFDRHDCRWRVLGDAADVHRSAERKAILEALRLAEEPMSPAMLSAVTGQNNNNVRQLLFQMASAGEVLKSGRGKYLHPDITPHNIDNNITRKGSGADYC